MLRENQRPPPSPTFFPLLFLLLLILSGLFSKTHTPSSFIRVLGRGTTSRIPSVPLFFLPGMWTVSRLDSKTGTIWWPSRRREKREGERKKLRSPWSSDALNNFPRQVSSRIGEHARVPSRRAHSTYSTVHPPDGHKSNRCSLAWSESPSQLNAVRSVAFAGFGGVFLGRAEEEFLFLMCNHRLAILKVCTDLYYTRISSVNPTVLGADLLLGKGFKPMKFFRKASRASKLIGNCVDKTTTDPLMASNCPFVDRRDQWSMNKG